MVKRADRGIQIRNSTNDFLVFVKERGGDGIDVLVADDNVWLTQGSLCSLYDAAKSSVSEHLKSIFASGELDEDSVVRKFRTTASDGKTYNYKYYSLQATRQIPMSQDDWKRRLDLFLQAADANLLTDAGKVTAIEAKIHAEGEFEKYRVVQDRLFSSDFDRFLQETDIENLRSDEIGYERQ